MTSPGDGADAETAPTDVTVAWSAVRALGCTMKVRAVFAHHCDDVAAAAATTGDGDTCLSVSLT